MVGGADFQQVPSAACWLNHSGGKRSGANRCPRTVLVTLHLRSSASEWSCRFLGRVLIWLTGSWQCPFGWAAKKLRRLFAEGEKLLVKKLHIQLVIAAAPQCCDYLCFKRSSVFFTSRQSFDKTGHLVGGRRRRENWWNVFAWLPNWSELRP